ncbi:J domain-containing protein [Microterricola viridarii]|uniref:Molecular chaperone DnaJ n=1 Tax=Microterricola viridarii TaxID=412690 RepID=A0A0X8E3U4_9MICO|nr:J domain-containing protein [Microterricola viridarii]AMB59212.1 molecular chaperone DnaJ [Microterricola viridarii]
MQDSPLSASPYEVLGVAPGASDEELRKAYRRMLRATHPDTGGDTARFDAVQRAWLLVGTTTARAAYDRGGAGAGVPTSHTWTAQAAGPRRDSRPTARSHGHPGGWSRERYLVLMREWVGRGRTLSDPYDPALVRSAPRDIRHLLANALAEEATARQVATLGIGFSVWHDVATSAAGPGVPPKLDHVVLGPTGLFALSSEDWGGEVRIKRGELIGEALNGEQPVHDLAVRAKSVARAARVKFTGLLIVVPDAAAPSSLELLGKSRGAVTALVTQSRLPGVLRDGLPGAARIGGTELFEVRTRLQAAITFV